MSKTIGNSIHSTVHEVAILMATYNGEKFLPQQFDSLFSQENVSLTIFIRDDGSSDETLNIVNRYAAVTGRIQVLPKAVAQQKVTRNFFSIVRDVDFKDFDYVAYCDQDDIWFPNKLNEAIKSIKEKKVDCYASSFFMGDKDASIVKNTSPLAKLISYISSAKTNTQTKFDFYLEAASAGCTLVINKESAVFLQSIIRKVLDQLPVMASHDWSTYAITRANGFTWYIDTNAYIIYRQHTENAYGANFGMKGISKLLTLFRSGWYREHILMIDDLYNVRGEHPPFINLIREKPRSITARWRIGFAMAKYRRKRIHRVVLFLLVLFGYFK